MQSFNEQLFLALCKSSLARITKGKKETLVYLGNNLYSRYHSFKDIVYQAQMLKMIDLPQKFEFQSSNC